jgi:hypothetical protein
MTARKGRTTRSGQWQNSCSNGQGKLGESLPPIPHNLTHAPNVIELHKLLAAILCLFEAI